MNLHGFRAGFWLQCSFYRQYPDMFIPVFVAPLYTVIFAMILREGARADLTPYAVVAPFYMSLWSVAIVDGGRVITTERWEGTANYLLAAPAGFAAVVIGRISTTVVAALVCFAEVWLVGLGIGVRIVIYHPVVFALNLLCAAFAMTTTALLLSGLFVLARNASTFFNSFSYPFYLLSGVLVPVPLLPDWLRPLSHAVFLYWSANLLRESLLPAGIPGGPTSLVMILALGLATFGLAIVLLHRILRRVRTTGELELR